MKTKQTILVAGIFAAGLLLELTAVAGEINVKKETGSADAQVVAPVAGATSAPSANPNIKVEILKSKDSQTPYPVLKDDLVNAGSPALAKVLFEDFTRFGACNAAALNDGEVGTPSNQVNVTFDLDGQWTTTFLLDISKSPKGYDISEIKTAAGWPPNRACQKYELLISKVSEPEKFISQGTFEADAEGGLATQIKLTGKQNLIESNVSALKFKFMVAKSAALGGNETAYREIDIIGTASEK